ncbi:MAG: hypothetical protein ACJA1H_002705 [Glaciecola sp.]|jgi:hypothetical protein
MKILKLCIILVLCTSCGSDDDAPTSPNENVEFTVIADAILNGTVDVPQQNLVIGNEADWLDLMNLVDETGNIANINETDIDFSQYMILGVIDQLRTSGGYDS